MEVEVMSAKYTIALAGNPNAGKSTIFNALTGARQHVGNWPGKTVEKKEGIWQYDGIEFEVVDLPGTYSLTAYSLEEIIARDYIVEKSPDLVVIVVDAANLERNLYLAIQIIEMGAKALIALNMSDIAESRGIKIDIDKLSQGLGVRAVPTVACRNCGIHELKEAIIEVVKNQQGD
jgi:ferrous iron transport protein B